MWNLIFFKNYACAFECLDENVTSDPIIKNFGYFIATKVDNLDKGFRVSKSSDISSKQFDLVSLENATRGQIATFLKACSCERTGSAGSFSFIMNLKSSGFALKPHTCSGRTFWFKSDVVHDICIDGEIFQIPDGASIIARPLEDSKQIFTV